MRQKIYRSARADEPHLGHGSFWTFSKEHAEWFAGWEKRTIPELGPSRIYITEVDLSGPDVVDLRSLGPVEPDRVLAGRRVALRKRGYRWVLMLEGPIEGSQWIVAVYVGEQTLDVTMLECGEVE